MALKVSPMNGTPKADGGKCLQQLGHRQSWDGTSVQMCLHQRLADVV